MRLRCDRFGGRLASDSSRSQGETVRHYIGKDRKQHQRHQPNSPIPMRVFQKVMARVQMIPWIGSFALHIVLVRAHLLPIMKRKKPTQQNTSGVHLRRLTL